MSIYIALIALYIVLTIFKTVFFKSKNILDYLYALLLIASHLTLSLLFKEQLIYFHIGADIIALFLAGYAIYMLFHLKTIDVTFNRLSNRLLKNAPFDYFLATDKDDLIWDYSDSFKELVKLGDDDLKNTKGFQTLMVRLDIQTFNNEKFNDTQAVKLDFEYRSMQTKKIAKFFEMGIIENGEVINLSFIVEPVFLHNKFIGRNIYISKNNKETLDRIENGLNEAKEMIKKDRAALYCMLSMCDDVIMFYDYNCNKYLLTEATCKKYGIFKRELAISDFFALIHPKDIMYYEEQSEIITSIEVTRLNYRIKLGNEYILINDDVMYLNKNENLISIISYYHETKDEQMTNEERKTIKPNIDYKEKLEDMLRILAREIDE